MFHEWNNYESIIAEPQFVNNIKLQFLKMGIRNCYQLQIVFKKKTKCAFSF